MKYSFVMAVMKMGNIVLRAGLETHIFGIPGQCATIIPHRLLDVTTIPYPPADAAHCLIGQQIASLGEAL